MINSIDKISVVHFRHTWGKPTETFLYQYIKNYKKTRPILVGYKRINEELFPFDCPIVPLYPKWSKARFERSIRYRLNLQEANKHYNQAKTFKTIREFDVRLIHAHFGYTGYYALPVQQRTNLPLVTTFYGHDISRMPDIPGWDHKLLELFEQGDLFLVEGPFMEKRLHEIGCPSQKSGIQRIAIDCELYPFHIRKPKEKSKNIEIFFCASIREKKGLIYALEAVARAHQHFSNLVFYIAGDGPCRTRIEDKITELKMGSYTHLLGFLTHKQMIKEMNTADIFIQPSVTAQDGNSEGGAPTTILEAQACGIPVLATTHADIPYVVVSGTSALLSPEKDVEALYNNLMTLLNFQEMWVSMGRTGREFIEEKHDVHKEVQRLEDRYYQLVNSK